MRGRRVGLGFRLPRRQGGDFLWVQPRFILFLVSLDKTLGRYFTHGDFEEKWKFRGVRQP